MKTLDILILIPLIWGAWNGYRKGLLIEIIAVIAFVVAMVVGFRFLGFGIELLSPYISRELARKLLPWLGFSVIFFPTVFMINQMGYSLRQSLRYTLLGTFDSIVGAAVGIFTWVFGISVLFWLFSYMGVKIPANQTQGTYLYPVIRPVAPAVMRKTAVWVPKGLEAGKKINERISD
ncbi:CvpA family protein [Arsenicibacter rosenii]|uniref:Colicin V production protein n=1 Tax=Arsenicibacter rosenii TaxID=1750698 RepID=A0A1S2VG89_9BACT|nr:CvpA family protein [Arsenicibacter rosenii]OIN57734.1 colicin V production protein [Arsenicibacter rosenii]